MKKYLYSLLITFCLFNITKADWSLDFSTNSGFTNNLTNNYKNQQDTYIAPQIRISGYGDNFAFYYKSSTTQLVNSVKYNRYKNKSGLNYYKQIANNINFYSGARALWRKNTENYSYYDYLDSKLFVYLKTYFSKRTYMKAGISSNYKNFFEVEAWNHLEHNIWAMINSSLPSRTTLRGYVSYKRRNFLPYQEANNQTQEINTLWLLESRFRIAQSISRNLGGYTEFTYQYNPSKGNPDELNFSSFSPIDDYFGYLGWEWKTNLKIKFSKNFTTALTFNLYEREYLNRPVYEYNLDKEYWVPDTKHPSGYNFLHQTREDKGYRMNLSGEYKLKKFLGSSNKLSIKPYIYYKNNTSNDVYFEYNKFGLGIDLIYLFDI